MTSANKPETKKDPPSFTMGESVKLNQSIHQEYSELKRMNTLNEDLKPQNTESSPQTKNQQFQQKISLQKQEEVAIKLNAK